MNKPTNKRPQLKRNYEALKFEAMVLYIKEGLSAEAISKRINVSMPTLQKWNKAGRWNELRPDMEILGQYKAATLYIVDGLTTGAISQKLSIPEITLNAWVALNGWNAARLVSQSKDLTTDVVASFCQYFKMAFPGSAAMVNVVQDSYSKRIIKK